LATKCITVALFSCLLMKYMYAVLV